MQQTHERTTEHSESVRALNGALVVLGAVTIAAGLYFAAIDRLLLTSAVCLLGLLPAGALAFAIDRRTPTLSASAKLKRQRDTGRNTLIVGGTALVAGGVLTLLVPTSPLGSVLLWLAPGMILGGGWVYRRTRSGHLL